MADQTPNFWRKLEILLAPLGGLLTAISVAVIGSYGAYVLNKKQEIDARNKVFTELTSQREQAETVMRKDMFAQIIESVLKPEKSSQDLTILNMELLAYNCDGRNLVPKKNGRPIEKSRGASDRTNNETLSVVAMRVCNPYRSPVGINAAPTPIRCHSATSVDGWVRHHNDQYTGQCEHARSRRL